MKGESSDVSSRCTARPREEMDPRNEHHNNSARARKSRGTTWCTSVTFLMTIVREACCQIRHLVQLHSHEVIRRFHFVRRTRRGLLVQRLGAAGEQAEGFWSIICRGDEGCHPSRGAETGRQQHVQPPSRLKVMVQVLGDVCRVCQPDDFRVSVHRCGSCRPCFVALRGKPDHLLGCGRKGFETFLCSGRHKASRCHLYGKRVRQVRPNVGPNCAHSAKCGSLGQRARLGGRSTASQVKVTFVDTGRPQVRLLADCDAGSHSFGASWRHSGPFGRMIQNPDRDVRCLLCGGRIRWINTAFNCPPSNCINRR